jgi:hypothetical protein
MRTPTISVVALIGVSIATVTLMTDDPVAISAEAPVVLRIGEMTAERAAHQATVLPDGRVLITGGCAGDGCTLFHSSTELYDPTSRSFQSAAPMTVPRASHTATLLQDGRVLVAGGCSERGATASAEAYDAEAERWTPVGEMTEPRCSHIAVPLVDGRVFVMGGGSGRLGDLGSAEIFDPAMSTFSSLGGMRANHYLATRLPDGRVLLTGGQSEGGEILATAELFDPASDRFESTGDMTTARVKHAAVVLPDGRVLVIGGSDRRGYDGRFSSTEIYDPDTGRFSPGPELQYGRHKIRDAVAALPSGAVVVAGGAVRPELYDPADRVFVPARGELAGPQMFATASALESGDVLVLGGYDRRTRLAADAWIITPAP